MGTLADKLAYLSDTKSAIRTAIGSDIITDDTPFRDYASVITDKLNNVAYQMVIGSSLAITDAINAKFDSIKIFGFCANEAISITENVALMGIPLPKIILNAIEILKDKGESKK